MGKRIVFGIEVGGLLALLTIPAAALLLIWIGRFSLPSLLVATTPASVTAALIIVAVLILPDLAADGEMRTPMNLAFPVIFAVINLVVVRAIWFTPSLVRSPNEVLSPIQVWFDPRTIVMAFAFQVIALTIACRPWAREA